MRLETRPVWMHRFWYRMVGWQQPRQLVEVGTAAGLSTAALAAGAPSGAELFALEGDSKLRGIAEATCRELADRLSAEVSFFGGVAEDVLPDLRPELTQLDAAFLDALATEAFLDRLGPMLLEVLSSGGFLAIPDIYRSPGAERAWGRLAGHPRVNAAWDFYHFGLLWTDPDLTPGYRRVYLGLLPGMAL
jgi:predicted O-methyltransferase YrrM